MEEPECHNDIREERGSQKVSIKTAVVVVLCFLALTVMLPIVYIIWIFEVGKRQEFAIEKISNILSSPSDYVTPLEKDEFEKLLRDWSRGRKANISLYKIESDDFYIILLIHRPYRGSDSQPPIIYISRDDLDELVRVEPEELN